jgi:integrase
MAVLIKPRYCLAKTLADGQIAWYWTPPTRDKANAVRAGTPFPFTTVSLGTGLSQAELNRAAKHQNDLLDAWRADRTEPGEAASITAYGSVGWLLAQYQKEKVFLANVSERSRADYRNLFKRITEHPTKTGAALGTLPVRSITPRAAQKLYDALAEAGALRMAEKLQEYCNVCWRRMQPLYPDAFAYHEGAFLNPWPTVARVKRQRKVKAAVTRAEVYAFAAAAIAQGRPEAGAAAVICFEWLQRPENAVGGHITWADYRGRAHPDRIRIFHHKTGAEVLHHLQMTDPETGETVLLYPEAEAVLAALPRRGLSMILGPEGQLYKPNRFAAIVKRVAEKAGLPHLTLDACRHGGMTELEEAELTEGQGRALSAHKTGTNYRRYAKLTDQRVMGATLKRHAHRLGQG